MAQAIKSTADTEAPRKYKFKDFIEKYSPVTVWEQIDRENAEGANYTKQEELEKLVNGIDPTDELMRLNVPNGDAKIVAQSSGRRWNPKQRRPEPGFSNVTHDEWENKQRMVELMKQAIYQARNKMVIMQKLREEFRNQSSYKMGYLMAKTDFATKIFAQFAYRALRTCSNKRQERTNMTKRQVTFLELVYMQEKQMHLWFEVDLLKEVFWTNHLIAKRVTNKRKIINQKKWAERFVN